MNTIEKNLKTDGKKFNQIPSNVVHDRILQDLNNPTVDYIMPSPKPLIWLLPIALVIMLVTIINITWNTPNHSTINGFESSGLELEKANLDILVKNIENKITSEIENEQMAILNDIKQFNSLFLL